MWAILDMFGATWCEVDHTTRTRTQRRQIPARNRTLLSFIGVLNRMAGMTGYEFKSVCLTPTRRRLQYANQRREGVVDVSRMLDARSEDSKPR